MRRTGLAAAVATLVGIASPASASTESCMTDAVTAPDPIALYGPEYRLDVRRDGARIGTHAFRFRRDGDRLAVDVAFEAEIRFLFFTAFRYVYESSSVWRDSCLVSLRANTNDDGDPSHVEATRVEGGLRIEGPKGTNLAEATLLPTDHWNANVLGHDRVLNTITGDVAEVRIVDAGAVAIDVGDATLQGRRYVYEGDLVTEVWYDADGRWLGMRYRGKDGSTIEHVCEGCSVRLDPAS